MLHFVMPCMKHTKKRKQTLESAQYGLEIIFKWFVLGYATEELFRENLDH